MTGNDASENSRDRNAPCSRRCVLTSSLLGLATASVPGAMAVEKPPSDEETALEETSFDNSVDREELEEIPSIEREVVRETDEYVLVKCNVADEESDEVVYLKEYTSGSKEGTIEILESADVPTGTTSGESVDPAEIAADSDWKSVISDFNRFQETIFESCIDDNYGYHGWRGASVELTHPIKYTTSAALTAIVEHILEPLGLPELSTIAGFIVGLIGSWAVQEFTMGGVDRDGIADVKYTQAKAAKKWDADADEGIKAGKIPGVHLG